MSRSRYYGLATYEDEINGRAVSIPELPERPDLESLKSRFVIDEHPPEGESFDLFAYRKLGTMDAWWIVYSLNEDVAPDPLEIPEGVSLVVPGAARAGAVLDGGAMSDL